VRLKQIAFRVWDLWLVARVPLAFALEAVHDMYRRHERRQIAFRNMEIDLARGSKGMLRRGPSNKTTALKVSKVLVSLFHSYVEEHKVPVATTFPGLPQFNLVHEHEIIQFRDRAVNLSRVPQISTDDLGARVQAAAMMALSVGPPSAAPPSAAPPADAVD
jgi:hypothetical protein